MPKPFWIQKPRRNFVGSGQRASGHQVQFDRRVDWTSRIPRPPPPPGPELILGARSAEVAVQGGEFEIDTATTALIEGQPGTVSMSGSVATITANQAAGLVAKPISATFSTGPGVMQVFPPWTPTPSSDLLIWLDAMDASTVLTSGMPAPGVPQVCYSWSSKAIYPMIFVGSDAIVFSHPEWVIGQNGHTWVHIEDPYHLMIAMPTPEEEPWHSNQSYHVFAVLYGTPGVFFYEVSSGTGDYENEGSFAFAMFGTHVGPQFTYHTNGGWIESFGGAYSGPTPPAFLLSGWARRYKPGPLAIDFMGVGGRDYSNNYEMSQDVDLKLLHVPPFAFYLGGQGTDNLHIGEILVYDHRRTPTQSEDVIMYFKRKWGV